MTTQHATAAPTALIVGASRGLGLGLVAELAQREWHVIGTVRGTAPTPLHEVARCHPGRVSVETVDIDVAADVEALRTRLSGRELDILFVNAGVATQPPDARVGAVDTAEFNRVMLTNVLGPMRVIEVLADLVHPTGLIGAMSSGQGSITNNTNGKGEVYRASKAALNMSLRSFAAGERGPCRSMLLLAPGWIRTALGGPEAPYSLEESVPKLVDILLAKRGRPGLEYLNRDGLPVPW